MKKLRKAISLLVVMVMAMSLIPQTVLGATYTTAFESYFQGWGNWSAASLDNVNTFYCVTDEIAHSGNHSVVIKHADSSQNWNAVTLAQDGLSYGAGDYTFSFWAAGNYAMELCGMTTNGDHWDDFYLTDFTAAETEGDWIKYTVDFTVPEGKTQNAITLMSNGNTQGLFLDDISLVAKGTTNNLLKNGSFDFNKVAEYSAELEPYFYGWGNWSAATLDNVNKFYCVTDKIAHSGNHSVVIKHTDSSQNWSAVMIAQDVIYGPGDYTLSFWAAGTYANNLCGMTRNGSEWDDYYITDFAVAETDGDWTKYSVDFTISGENNAITLMSNGDTQCLYVDDISLVAKGTTENLLTNASFEKTEAEEPEVPEVPTYTEAYAEYRYGWGQWNYATPDGNVTFACVTDEIAHDGSKSIVLRHANTTGDNLMVVQEGFSAPAGTYTVSFWAVGTGNKQFVNLQGEEWLNRRMESCTAVETDGIWSKYELSFTVPEGKTNNTLVFGAEAGTEGWYIDDISLVKQGTTENLLTNASFEKTEAEEPEEPEVPTYTTEFEDYFTNWEKETAIAENGSTIFTCVTDETAHNGNYSVILRSLDTGDKDLMIKQTGLGLGEGTYTFSFWATGTVADWDNDSYRYQQIVWLEGLDPSYRYVTDMTTSEIDGDWRKYVLEFTVPAGSTVNAIKLSTRGHGTEGLYVDDFNLVKSGTTENILKNGSFEDDGKPDYKTNLSDYFYGWSDWSAVERDGNLVFLCVTDEIAHSGNNSFVLRHVDSSKTSNISLAQNIPSLQAATYTLSFWATGFGNGLEGITLADPWRIYRISNFNITATDGIWNKYEMTVTATGGETAITFLTDGNTNGWFIDDISLVKEGTTKNIIKNGSFDDDGMPDYTTAYEDYFYGWEKEYGVTENGSTIFSCVTGEMAHSGSNSVILRHVDESQNDRDLMIKQAGLSLGEGTYTLSFWASGTVADLDNDTYRYQQIVWLEGLDPSYRYVTDMTTGTTDGDWSYYTLDFTVPAGSTVSAIKLSTRGHGTEYMYVDDFSLVKSGTTENVFRNGSFEDNGVPEYKTNLSDYFAGWNDWSAVERDGNLVFLCVTDEMAHDGDNSFVLRHVDSSKPSNICLAQNIPSLEAGNYTISFWAVGTTNNGMQAVTLADPWNKYPVEGFQITDTDGIWSKYEMTVTATGGETAISFLTDGNTNGWFIDEISLVKTGTTENIIKNGSFEYKGLDGYYMSTPKVVKIDGENRRELAALESGTLEVSLEYTNYTMGDSFAPIMFVALYDGGRLKTVEFAKQSTNESQLDGFLEDELCFTVTVPQMTEETDYQLKVMCWENITGIKPLIDVLGLE